MTSASRVEGSAVYRFRFGSGLASGEAHFTGVLNGDDMTLRFDKTSVGWALGSSWSGFVHRIDDGITLNLPEGGRLFAAAFDPATAEDYNRALKRAGL
jgi:hypothetical protein